MCTLAGIRSATWPRSQSRGRGSLRGRDKPWCGVEVRQRSRMISLLLTAAAATPHGSDHHSNRCNTLKLFCDRNKLLPVLNYLHVNFHGTVNIITYLN